MQTDRYTKAVLTVIAAALVWSSLSSLTGPARLLDALGPGRLEAQGQCPAVSSNPVPAGYRLIGSTPRGLLFENDEEYVLADVAYFAKNISSGQSDCWLLKVKKK